MARSFRFLFQFTWLNLAALAGFVAVIVLGAYVTGVPQGASNLFRNYFVGFPVMAIYMLYIYGFAFCTSNLHLALSLGAKRRDFFWALQGMMAVYTAAVWVLQCLIYALPRLGNWDDLDRWQFLMESMSGVVFPGICFLALVLGCLSGLVMARSKVIGVVLIILAVLLMLAGVILLFLMEEIAVWAGESWGGLWGDLPFIILAVMIVALAVGEAMIWRSIHRHVVR